MTTQAFVTILLAIVLAVYAIIAIRTWVRFRGARVVTCPETRQPAGVAVDIGHAMVSAVWERADVRIGRCSRWPEREGCDEACVAQIEASLDGTRAKTIAARFFKGRRCAICQSRIAPRSSSARQPGFLNPVTREAVAWIHVPPQNLPDVLASRHALCADCTLAESARQPLAVTYRRARPGSPPPH
jgi:hypothetical protein